MPPLILHNVPDDELYTGEDGIQRPYAMIFPDSDRQRDAPRRRAVPESGSFGKSTRRSRSRTGSLPPKREDATMQGADKLFADYVSSQEPAAASNNPQRKTSYLSQAVSPDDAVVAAQAPRFVQEPTEVILRGYRSSAQQYAAISQYEQLAGRICEDYSREPPIEQRRYKSELRDSAFTRRRALTPQERTKVNRVDGGEHWIKVTFESADAAESAIYASPQKIMGHLVFAEAYRGMPPKEDAAVMDMEGNAGMLQDEQPNPRSFRGERRRPSASRNQNGKAASNLPKSWLAGTPAVGRNSSLDLHGSPPESQTSTHTIDSATMSSNTTGTASTATVTGAYLGSRAADYEPVESTSAITTATNNEYCRRIPEARRIKVISADQALLPQPGVVARLTSRIPLIKWLSGSMIGDEVPRLESGEFDFNRASLYWRVMYYLDSWFGLFGKEIVSADKDD
ncbi:hypothetical protein PG991_011292 [Apiospora marii]|uniref:Nucleoporin NUP53 n=1 Tax=Apiospora marii TaxID=335849 RepID=A0ABR1RDS0_9PEZI